MTSKNYIAGYDNLFNVNNIREYHKLQEEIDTYYNQLMYYSKVKLWGQPYRNLTTDEVQNINTLLKSNDLDTMRLLKAILLTKLNEQ